MVAIPNAPRLSDMPKGEPIPEGLYYLRVDKAEYQVTKPNPAKNKPGGEPMAVCQLTVFGPADQEAFLGRKVFENFMLSGEGLFRTRMFLEASGESEDFVLEDTDQLVGKEAAGLVQIEQSAPSGGKTYEPRNRVKKYLPIK